MIVYRIWCLPQAIRIFSEVCDTCYWLTASQFSQLHPYRKHTESIRIGNTCKWGTCQFFCPVILNSENTLYSENQMYLYTVLITPAVFSETSLVCWRTRHTRLITSVRVGKEITHPKFTSIDHLNATWTSSFGWFMWKLVTTALERTQHYNARLTAYTHALSHGTHLLCSSWKIKPISKTQQGNLCFRRNTPGTAGTNAWGTKDTLEDQLLHLSLTSHLSAT